MNSTTHPIRFAWVLRYWFYYVLIYLGAMALIAFGITYFTGTPDTLDGPSSGELIGFVAVASLAALLIFGLLPVWWRARFSYEMTNEGIVVSYGFFVRFRYLIRWEQIENVELKQSWSQGLFGTASVRVPLKDVPEQLNSGPLTREFTVDRHFMEDGFRDWLGIKFSPLGLTSVLNISGLSLSDAETLTAEIQARVSKAVSAKATADDVVTAPVSDRKITVMYYAIVALIVLATLLIVADLIYKYFFWRGGLHSEFVQIYEYFANYRW